MSGIENVTHLRVRYGETDQMGTFYNSRALEWFECGRTELLRAIGAAYAGVSGRKWGQSPFFGMTTDDGRVRAAARPEGRRTVAGSPARKG